VTPALLDITIIVEFARHVQESVTNASNALTAWPVLFAQLAIQEQLVHLVQQVTTLLQQLHSRAAFAPE
jgi:hypothetical protein